MSDLTRRPGPATPPETVGPHESRMGEVMTVVQCWRADCPACPAKARAMCWFWRDGEWFNLRRDHPTIPDVVDRTHRARLAKMPSSGIERIASERRRQVEAEGWTPEHDCHADGVLAQAAACYAVATVPQYAGHYPISWPWSPRWDKRPGKTSDVTARIRALEKAGALCAAEIDRLLRAAPEVTS